MQLMIKVPKAKEQSPKFFFQLEKPRPQGLCNVLLTMSFVC